jgi:hypothetical protein
MPNFSLITATDPDLDIKITVEPLVGNGPPTGRITMCDRMVFDGSLEHTITVCAQIGLHDDVLVAIELRDKIYDLTRETALHITSIEVDGLEIKDHCYDLIEYTNDQDVRTQSLYLGFNGRWVLRIPGPFYRWWHTVTGQGWLLCGARSISQSCAASSTNTNDVRDHNASGNSGSGKDPTIISILAPAVR